MVHFAPLKKPCSAKDTADLLLYLFQLDGIPVDVISNQGPQFTSTFSLEFCFLMGASVSLSSAFHPQSNGQSGRKKTGHRNLPLMPSKPSTWSQQLAWVEYANNTLVSSAPGLSPLQCSYRYQPPLFPFPVRFRRGGVLPLGEAFVCCQWTWRHARSARQRSTK